MFYIIQPTSNDLYHHGILGQRWGRKNGPPYPLGSGDHSASEKKAGYKKSIGGGRNPSLYSENKKRPVSIKAAANKALAKVYEINEKTYAKSNKTLSNMNKHAKEKYLKKAEDAQKEVEAKKMAKDQAKKQKNAEKINNYVGKKAQILKDREAEATENANRIKDNIRDLDKYGYKSNTYKINSTDFYDGHVRSIKEVIDMKRSELDSHVSDGKKYMNAYNKLMNMDVSEFNSKREVRKAIRESFRNTRKDDMYNDSVDYIKKEYSDMPITKKREIDRLKKMYNR